MPKKIVKRFLAPLLVALVATGTAAGQDSTFNPANPPEPDMKFKVNVVADPAERANVSGSGYYDEDATVYINSSSRDIDWELKSWTIDGITVSTDAGFYYTVADRDVEIVAHYGLKIFNPASPAEPDMGILKRPLTIISNPAEACSFNIASGTKYSGGSKIYVQCYLNQGFVLKGWYAGDELVSTSRGFTYTMPEEPVVLEARFTFNPDSPSEPEAVLIKGDVNVDYRVDSLDSSLMAKNITNAEVYSNLFDVNGDGNVDSVDISAIIKIIVGADK